jgi:6-pyruvoyltetrahydropterin/6-carboxytetrahydropterin synthase
LVNIKSIDHAVRDHAQPILESVCRDEPSRDPASVLSDLLSAIGDALPTGIVSVRLHLSPYYSVEMADDARDTVLIRQKFDFAAAHRLHAPHLSDEENRATFGRCNNPSGHGHNYQVEPCVAIEPGAGFTLADLERITDDTVIDPFDHTHLNEDTEAFRTGSGLNPSVENIAKVFFERLGPAIAAAGAGIALRSVTVWETDRTSCTYPG